MNAEQKPRSKAAQVEEGDESPIRQAAIVQCNGFKCMAFQDKDNVWVDVKGRPLEIMGIVSWLA